MGGYGLPPGGLFYHDGLEIPVHFAGDVPIGDNVARFVDDVTLVVLNFAFEYLEGAVLNFGGHLVDLGLRALGAVGGQGGDVDEALGQVPSMTSLTAEV